MLQYSKSIEKRLPELIELERLFNQFSKLTLAEIQIHKTLYLKGNTLPLYSLTIGNDNSNAPAIGFFGGVHGLERIGTQVILAYMQTLLERLKWDERTVKMLKKIKIVFMPLINPTGMYLKRRSNVNGVDLNRNAPVDAEGKATFLVGGHRYSKHLPWYRGEADAVLEDENKALVNVVKEKLLKHSFSLAIDCHSGFGSYSRIWFPYAKKTQPFESLGSLYALNSIFDATYPNHSYRFEPQAEHYTTHGDLWDYLYGEHILHSSNLFLPLTLEMGSWLWVKKNPYQLFTLLGLFNPTKQHRLRRVLRQHLPFFDFLTHATMSNRKWVPQESEVNLYRNMALRHWYK